MSEQLYQYYKYLHTYFKVALKKSSDKTTRIQPTRASKLPSKHAYLDSFAMLIRSYSYLIFIQWKKNTLTENINDSTY